MLERVELWAAAPHDFNGPPCSYVFTFYYRNIFLSVLPNLTKEEMLICNLLAILYVANHRLFSLRCGAANNFK